MTFNTNRTDAELLRQSQRDPDAFLESHAEAAEFPEQRWQERATPSETQASFLLDDGGGMVSCIQDADQG